MEPVTIQLGGYFNVNAQTLSPYHDFLPISYDVPANNRLVIESVSALASFPPGDSILLKLALAPTTEHLEIQYELPLQYQATYNPYPDDANWAVRDWWSLDRTIRAYIPKGGQLSLVGQRAAVFALGEARVTITGYLEPIPVLKPFPFFFNLGG